MMWLLGKLFNKPTKAGTPGVDVYAGCQKDYTGNDVTAANFLAVLTGDKQTVSHQHPHSLDACFTLCRLTLVCRPRARRCCNLDQMTTCSCSSLTTAAPVPSLCQH